MIKMTAKFVTCIYNGLNGTKICGRLNRDEPYNYSLGAIAKTNADIVCYTSPHELNKLKTKFESMPNISFIEHDLYSFAFHERLNAIRDKNEMYRTGTDWRDRCVEIMWGKFIFIKNVIAANPTTEYIYWIDAGISHSGIIHSRFNSHYDNNKDFVRDLDKSTYPDTFKNDLIFNDKFMDNLIRYTGSDNILNIAATGPQHPLLASDHPFAGSVVGGLFGGKATLMDLYCDKIIALFEEFLANDILCKEEQLMTKVLGEKHIPIKKFTFTSWYHPDWGDRYNPDQSSFCDFFDVIA